MFQFPSNGKVYPKYPTDSPTTRKTPNQVSIPFKRESISKVKEILVTTASNVQIAFQFPSNGKVYPKMKQSLKRMITDMFQFPSNGKVYPKGTARGILVQLRKRFNSLQTGKYIQRSRMLISTRIRGRFQFPSNGKVYPKKTTSFRTEHNFTNSFNSLQTGKYIQSSKPEIVRIADVNVSIPFKRESISKVPNKKITEKIIMFQFPSNGKVYPKKVAAETARLPTVNVSIPFKRESISKAVTENWTQNGA